MKHSQIILQITASEELFTRSYYHLTSLVLFLKQLPFINIADNQKLIPNDLNYDPQPKLVTVNKISTGNSLGLISWVKFHLVNKVGRSLWQNKPPKSDTKSDPSAGSYFVKLIPNYFRLKNPGGFLQGNIISLVIQEESTWRQKAHDGGEAIHHTLCERVSTFTLQWNHKKSCKTLPCSHNANEVLYLPMKRCEN